MGGNQVKASEKISFFSGLLGQNIIYGFVSIYILFFYTDVVKISSATVGIIFLIARVWDGINDPIMGSICDKTRTKRGKFRPYFAVTPLIIGILTISLFFIPNCSYNLKVAYVFITYILWGMAYTICDIPIWSLTAVITTNKGERDNIITLSKVIANIGIILSAAFLVQLIQFLGKGDAPKGYFYTAVIIGVFAFITMSSIFFFVREKVQYNKEKPKFLNSFKILMKNKLFVKVIIVNIIINFVITIIGSFMLYFATYNLGNSELMTLLIAVPFPFMIIGILIAGKLFFKFDKKDIVAVSALIMVLINLVYYFVGYSSLLFVVVINCIDQMLIGVIMVCVTSMIADAIDITDEKYGVRLEGITFSMQSFSVKLAAGLAGAVQGFALKLIGYVPDSIQSSSTLKGLFGGMSLLPVLAGIITIILMKLNLKSKNNEIKVTI